MSDFEFEKPKRGARAANKQEDVKIEAPALKLDVAPEEKESDKSKAELPKKKEYDKNELLHIFDEIIFNGEYLEDVTIRGKLKVQFKTRTAEELEEISKLLDATTYNLVATLNENRLLLNLQYGMTSYQGRNLAMMKGEDRAKFIRKLPGPVIALLVDALYEFDTKVMEACKELEENF